MEIFVDDISAYELKQTASDAAYKEHQPRLLPESDRQEIYDERANPVNRYPRPVSRAALKEFAFIYVDADGLIDKADNACDSKDQQEQRDSLFRAILTQNKNSLKLIKAP